MNIQIIVGSTRPTRVGKQVAEWVEQTVPSHPEFTYEIVDLQKINLPMFNEPQHPSTGEYTHAHTKAWSEIISKGDGYIFVTPEYNAGYPASLKNAIDYLYHEWTNKPALIISYGAGGGGTAAHQLHEVLTRLKFNVATQTLNILIPREILNDKGQIKDPAENFKDHAKALESAGNELIDLVNTNVAA